MKCKQTINNTLADNIKSIVDKINQKVITDVTKSTNTSVTTLLSVTGNGTLHHTGHGNAKASPETHRLLKLNARAPRTMADW